MVDPPWSPLAGWVYSYCCLAPGTRNAPLKISTELTRLYTGLYSALLYFTGLNYSFEIAWGSTLDASGLVKGCYELKSIAPI